MSTYLVANLLCIILLLKTCIVPLQNSSGKFTILICSMLMKWCALRIVFQLYNLDKNYFKTEWISAVNKCKFCGHGKKVFFIYLLTNLTSTHTVMQILKYMGYWKRKHIMIHPPTNIWKYMRSFNAYLKSIQVFLCKSNAPKFCRTSYGEQIVCWTDHQVLYLC